MVSWVGTSVRGPSGRALGTASSRKGHKTLGPQSFRKEHETLLRDHLQDEPVRPAGTGHEVPPRPGLHLASVVGGCEDGAYPRSSGPGHHGGRPCPGAAV